MILGLFIILRKQGFVTILKSSVLNPAIQERARLTLDYQADYLVIDAIFRELYRSGSIFSLSDVVTF